MTYTPQYKNKGATQNGYKTKMNEFETYDGPAHYFSKEVQSLNCLQKKNPR